MDVREITNQLYAMRQNMIPQCEDKLAYILDTVVNGDHLLYDSWHDVLGKKIGTEIALMGYCGCISEIHRKGGVISVTVDYGSFEQWKKVADLELPLLLGVLQYDIQENIAK